MARAKHALGRRRRRLAVLAPVETPDSLGGASIVHGPVGFVWAEIEALSGDERAAGERLESAVQLRVTVRWRADLEADWRFADGARIYGIRALFDPDGRRRHLVCRCEEIRP